MLLNRLYICFTEDLLPTNANTNEAANDDGQQYVFDPRKNNNIFDEADNQSDEYDPLNDKEFQAIENNINANDEANNEADHEDEYNPDRDDWMPDNVDNTITASCSQHKKNNNDGTYHVHSQTSPTFPPTTNKQPHPTRQLDISSFTTQNAHGLRCCPCNTDGNIIPNGPHNYMQYEHLITSMKTKNLDVYFVQETWLEGDVFDEVINGYHVLGIMETSAITTFVELLSSSPCNIMKDGKLQVQHHQ
jgi:hypothetical protein